MADNRKRDAFTVRQTNIQYFDLNHRKSTKLTDMNCDCIGQILQKLNVEDLISAAETNQKLKFVTDMAFYAKYRNNKFMLNAPPLDRLVEFTNSFAEHQKIIIKSTELTTKLIRIFGHHISMVEVWGRGLKIDTDFNEIEQYIQKYCLESLTSFVAINYPDNVLCNLKGTFKNVENICFGGARFNTKLTERIRQVFPNVRVMQFQSVKIEPSVFKINNFPNMEHLRMDISDGDRLTTRSIRSAIVSNPNLQKIDLYEHFEAETYEFIARELPNLRALTIYYSTWHFEHFKGTPIRYKCVEDLSFFWNNDDDVDFVEPKPGAVFSFDRLKEVYIACWAGHVNSLVQFANANPTIEKITLNVNIVDGLLPSIGKELARYSALRQNRVEILLNVESNDMTVAETLNFLKANQYLAKFSMNCNSLEEMETLRTSITPPWKTTEFLTFAKMIIFEKSLV
ncbi:uncharacterized protein LOC116348773 [Contarinia nasturtii]|uniref:uncharacterized protein LOC116348773 n=1 Tax=Contarinia nasturtii TaxID=265458 RepID=UPI0012D3732D|nr:uncharacterized protein LOC116348773 [Contarinia nasturtii]